MNSMLGRVKRLSSGKSQAAPIHFFMLPLVFYGVGFLFFPTAEAVDKSSLHLAMLNLGGSATPRIWGGTLLLVFLGSMSTMFLKRYYLAHTAAFMGFLAWLFASIMYVQSDNWMLVGAITSPNLLFWLWFYGRVRTGGSTVHLNINTSKHK